MTSKKNDLSDWIANSLKHQLTTTSIYAVAMIRVSDKRQKGEAHFSDHEQRGIIENYMVSIGVKVEREWDIAETASKHHKRYGFNAMLDFVKKSQNTDRPIKHIVFSHQSRCARNPKSVRMIEELVYDFGVVIHFAREKRKFDCNGDLGELLLWILENANNAKFILDHTQNVMGGMRQKLESGGYCGLAPYGYINFRSSPKAPSIFKFDVETSNYIKSAFELCSTGLYFSVLQLSLALDKQFSHMERRPRMKRLYSLLRNPFYYGDFVWNGRTCKGDPEIQPPLISFDTWRRAQSVLDGRSHHKVTKKEFHYLSLIKCGGIIFDEQGYESSEPCDCLITAEEKRKRMKDGSIKTYYYYHCSNTTRQCSQRDKFHMQRIVGRKTVNYPEAEIEVLFEAAFRPFNWTPELVKRMQEILRAEHAQKSGDHLQQFASLRRRYEMLQTYMDKAYDDKLAGDLTPNEWREKNEKWKREREETKVKIDSLDAMKDEYIENGVLLIELAQRTEFFYKSATPEEKRQLVEIISSNRVLKDGTIEITYRKPFDLLAVSTSEKIWWSQQESNLQQPFRKGPLYPFNYGT